MSVPNHRPPPQFSFFEYPVGEETFKDLESHLDEFFNPQKRPQENFYQFSSPIITNILSPASTNSSSSRIIPDPQGKADQIECKSDYLSDTFKVEVSFQDGGMAGGRGKKSRRSTFADVYHSDQQLFLFPIITQKNGTKIQLKVLFQGAQPPSTCSVSVCKPVKSPDEKGKKKSNSDPFEFWPEETLEKMQWDTTFNCFTFSLETEVTTTNNQVYILKVIVKVDNHTPQVIQIPMAIPSRQDQIPEFIEEMLNIHKRAMYAARCSVNQMLSWFKPVIFNAWNTFLSKSVVHLNRFQLEQGFERRNNDIIELWKKDIATLGRILGQPGRLKEVAERCWIHFLDREASIRVLTAFTIQKELQLYRINNADNITIIRKKVISPTRIEFTEWNTDDSVWGVLSEHINLLCDKLEYTTLLPNGQVEGKETILNKFGLRRSISASAYPTNIEFQPNQFAMEYVDGEWSRV